MKAQCKCVRIEFLPCSFDPQAQNVQLETPAAWRGRKQRQAPSTASRLRATVEVVTASTGDLGTVTCPRFTIDFDNRD